MQSTPAATVPAPAHPVSASRRGARRRSRGSISHLAGLMAEDAVDRAYRDRGAAVLERRRRTPAGELDLVARDGDILVFVEVKHRRRGAPDDAPVSRKQWQRLELAANHYMLSEVEETGAVRGCRFDVALVGPDGMAHIVENARSFDAN
jgi:putative endonuclease